MLQAVFFDFDGVIADSEPLHLRAYQAVLDAEGISLPKEDYYARYLGYDDAGLFEALAQDRGIRVDRAKIDAWIDAKSRLIERMLSHDSILFRSSCVRERCSPSACRWPLRPELWSRRSRWCSTMPDSGAASARLPQHRTASAASLRRISISSPSRSCATL
jgi:hypothetical protein